MKKTALMIGASGDIGKAISTQLLCDNYRTYLHYYRGFEAVKELQQKYGAENAIPIQADLSDAAGIEILKQYIVGQVDVIIYNAGTTFYGLMTDIDEETKNRMIQLNITSLYSTIQLFLPKMLQQRKGNIIVISSIWGEIGASCEVLYSMVKGAQISFMKALAKEVALNGVRVNGIAPGAVETKMLYTFTAQELKELCEDIPMGRLAKPKEVAEAVSFLVSEKSSYITGQVLGINGGWN